MKKTVLFLLFTCAWGLSILFAQAPFTRGYIEFDSGNRQEVYIQDKDWRSNPTSIYYRLTSDGNAQMVSIDDVQSFEIATGDRFVRAEVRIDRASDITSNLSYQRDPEWSRETVFLRVLLESEATLLQYIDAPLTRYYYQKGDAPIEPLIYRRYKTDGTTVLVNDAYKGQLLTELACMRDPDLDDLEYQKGKLLDYFRAYAECSGQEIDYLNRGTPIRLRWSLHLGANLFNSALSNDLLPVSFAGTSTINSGFSARAGMSLEVLLPFQRYKWTAVIEPAFAFYNAESDEGPETELTYQALELTLGIRHYFFLTGNQSLFLNAGIVMPFEGTNSRYDLPDRDFIEISSLPNFMAGVGFRVGDLSLEGRFQVPRNTTNDFISWRGDLTVYSLQLGYTLF
jgi:hypothetical protein